MSNRRYIVLAEQNLRKRGVFLEMGVAPLFFQIDVMNKSRELYDWFVNTLIGAYMKNTLHAGWPCMCGVGNLLIAKWTEVEGCEPSYIQTNELAKWSDSFCTLKYQADGMGLREAMVISAVRGALRGEKTIREKGEYRQVWTPNHISEGILRMLDLPLSVLMDLEWEFETNQTGDTEDEQMFNGLLAAIAVLDKYFEIPPIESEPKKRLQLAYNARVTA